MACARILTPPQVSKPPRPVEQVVVTAALLALVDMDEDERLLELTRVLEPVKALEPDKVLVELVRELELKRLAVLARPLELAVLL